MSAVPLPQFAPFTCPSCGASLESKPGFCPRCGARLNAQVNRTPLSLALGLMFMLALGMMFFGVIGACGALVTSQNLAGQSGDYQEVFLIVSVPSLLFGLVGFAPICLSQTLK